MSLSFQKKKLLLFFRVLNVCVATRRFGSFSVFLIRFIHPEEDSLSQMKRMASAPPSFNPPPPTKRGRKEKGEEEELESLLPADIWNLILRWLGPKELLSCRATSTWLKIQVDGLDEVWERYHHSVLGSVRWKGASPQSLLQERRKDKKEESAKTTTTTTTTWFESYLNFHELFFSLQKKKKSDLSFDEQKLSRLAILNDSIPFVKCLKKLEMYSVDSDGPGRFDESKHLTLAIDEGFSDLACYLIVNDLFDDEEVRPTCFLFFSLFSPHPLIFFFVIF